MSQPSLLMICQHYRPETGAAAHRHAAMAGHLGRFFAVQVLTGYPSYPTNRIYPGYAPGRVRKERLDGLEVHRCYSPPWYHHLASRLIQEAWLSAVMIVRALWLTRPDIVYTSIPSDFVAFTGFCVSRARRSRLVIEVRDLLWRYMVDLGKAKPSLPIRVYERILLCLIRSADLVVVTTRQQGDWLMGQGVPAERILTVTNGLTAPAASTCELPPELPPKRDGDFWVAYTGTIGRPQGLGVLVEAARFLRNVPSIKVIIVGEGVEKAALREQAQDLDNVTFVAHVPRQLIPLVYARADVLFAHLRNGPSLSTALPSKLMDYMAAGKPIVYAGTGPGQQLILEAQCGVVVDSERPELVAEAILQLYHSSLLRTTLAENGLAHSRAHFGTDRLLADVTERLQSMVAGPGTAPQR